ncbi:c-type cytochrome [Comamonas testosteroni]|uniref:c-type cytochrome n=1 Tax=Comamonas testosteroni TaxID=285 RepID=UPI0036F3616D
MLTPARPALWLAFALAAPLPGLASSAATSLRVQDVAVLAASCANCHGPDGRSTGVIPQLRGLPEAHLLQRLQAFKAGTAKDATVMTRLAKGYDDEQLKALAQWFSKKGQ